MKEYIDRQAVIDMLNDRIEHLQNFANKKAVRTAIINLGFILGLVENLPTTNSIDDTIIHAGYSSEQMEK